MDREEGSLWDGGGRGAEPDLAQKQPVRDVLSQHEGRHQVVDGPRLPAVWPQHERMEAPLSGGPEDSIGSQAWCAQAPEPQPSDCVGQGPGSAVGSWLSGLNYRAPGAEKQPIRSKTGGKTWVRWPQQVPGQAQSKA